MKNKKEVTEVRLVGKYKEVYVRKEIFGLISWWTRERVEALGNDLVIRTFEEYDHIILNGETIRIGKTIRIKPRKK